MRARIKTGLVKASLHLLILSLRACLLAWAVILPSSIHAALTNSGTSSIITVDTRGTNIPVSGRVLDMETGLAISGATASLAGKAALSGSTGAYVLRNVDLSKGKDFTVSCNGYETQTETVTATPNIKAIVMPDLFLTGTSQKPVVEWISLEHNERIYLWGAGHACTVLAKVNWKNGTARQVTITANGHEMARSYGGHTPCDFYSAIMVVDEHLSPALRLNSNTLKVVAENTDGLKGERNRNVAVAPVPEQLSTVLLSTRWADAEGKLAAEFKFPPAPIERVISLPVLGKFGAKFQCEGRFDYELASGQWLLDLPKSGCVADVLLGKLELNAGVAGKFGGTATETSGVDFSIVEFAPTLGLSGEFELGAFGLPDLFGPGLSTWFSKFPFLRPVLNNVMIVIMAKPELSGQAAVPFSPSFSWKSLELTGKLGVEAFYEPKMFGTKVRFYVSGEPSVTFQVPGDVFKQVDFKAFAGGKVEAWTIDWKAEYFFVDYTYPSTAGRRLPTSGVYDLGNGYLIESAENKNATWKPVDRSYLNAGTEQFLLGASSPARRVSTLQNNPALELFIRMGNAPSPGAVYQPPASGPARQIASDSTLPAQAGLPLLSNVYPDAAPALTASGSNLMLLYARDTGVQNATQFTEIAFTWFDGTAWSSPAAVAADPRGQFSPKVAFDGHGNAVAVWEQIKDGAFTGTDLGMMAAQMELMTATWNATTHTWSPATALTNNAFLDHQPQIAGPLSNGDLVLTWVQNQGNQMMGSGTSGDLNNDRVMTARWDSATAMWGTPSILVNNLSSDFSHSLAAAGNKAVYVWSQDQDGDWENITDTELYYRRWDEPAGTWSAATRYTNDAVNDRNAKAAVGASGDVYVVWQRGRDLVMDRNFAVAPSIVRADATSMGFADFSLALGPGGNVLVLWEDTAAAGPDAHYRVFDPASNTWSLDTLLSKDAELESAFTPVWDAMGNLVVAYNNTQLTKQTVSVPLDGGGTINVPGVTQPGQVDLWVARRALVKDLSLEANALTATGTTFLAGDAVTLNAKVTNSGNVAVQNVQVGFYDGDPQNGGTLLQTVTLPGWLVASGSQTATITWAIPAPLSAHTVYAVVDPAGQVTEVDKTNNTQSLSLNGADLELKYLSGSVARDGSVHVVAQVKNIGAPESPVTTLKLWPKDNAGTTPLAAKDISMLNPGDAVQVILDLPAGSQAEGDCSYRLTVDDDKLSDDIDTNNNEVLFSLNLFLSTAKDGIPDWWKRQYGFSFTDPNVANADADGDGFTNYQEYLCGTNPTHSSSRLKMGEMNVTMQPDGRSGRFTVTWVPVANRYYTVERSFDLTTWTAIATHIKAALPLNSYTDTVTLPPGGTRCFYRVWVE